MGCGTGASILILANALDANITSIDLFPAFLHQLEHKAEDACLHHKINAIQASMDDISIFKQPFDIIWSEGSIYNIGFERGVQVWSGLLKEGGYMAISEITWL